MIVKSVAPDRAAVACPRLNITNTVNRRCRGLGLVLAAVIMFAAAFSALTAGSSAALADRGWSLGSSVSQTYKKRNWSAPSKLGHRVSKSRRSKKYRANRKSRKKTRVYRKASKNRRKKRRTRAASINKSYTPQSKSGGVRWAASSSCLNSNLKAIIHQVASRYGRVTVSSTCRSKKHNRRVGGAKRSQHLTGNAADFRVHGNYRAAYAYLKSAGGVGGYKHYGGGLFHIDTGARRTW